MDYYSTADLAAKLGVSRQQVARMVNAGLLPAIRRGRLIRVPVAAWDRFLAGQTEAALASLKRSKARQHMDKRVIRNERPGERLLEVVEREMPSTMVGCHPGWVRATRLLLIGMERLRVQDAARLAEDSQ